MGMCAWTPGAVTGRGVDLSWEKDICKCLLSCPVLISPPVLHGKLTFYITHLKNCEFSKINLIASATLVFILFWCPPSLPKVAFQKHDLHLKNTSFDMG